MQFTLIAKADVADDADPNTTPPAAGRIATVEPYIDAKQITPTQSIALRTRVLTVVPAIAVNGAADFIIWLKDDASGIWVHVDKAPQLVADQFYSIGIPALPGTTKVFVQVKAVAGVAADHVQIGVAAAGAMPPNVDIGTVNIDTGGGAGLATAVKQDTAQASLNTLNARTAITTTALSASKVLLAAPGTVRAAAGCIDATAPTATYYVHMLNAASLPVDGAVTHLMSPIVVAHVNGLADEFGFDDRIPVGGIAASIGAVMALSSTLATLTISGAYLLAAGAT